MVVILMIHDSLYFNYDGIDSTTYKLINVNYNVTLCEELFLPEQELYTVQIPGRDDSYFMDSKRLPLQINLQFAFDEGFGENNEHIQAVSRWLFQDYYKPLIFSEQEYKIYHCMYVGDPNLLHTCNKEGLIEIVMQNISPYAYSPFYESEIYTSTKNIVFDNAGDVAIQPILILETIENTSFTLVNESNQTELRLKELLAGDALEIDLEYGMVNATNNGKKICRYDNLTVDNLRMDVGENLLSVVEHANDWQIKFKYQYKFL